MLGDTAAGLGTGQRLQWDQAPWLCEDKPYSQTRQLRPHAPPAALIPAASGRAGAQCAQGDGLSSPAHPLGPRFTASRTELWGFAASQQLRLEGTRGSCAQRDSGRQESLRLLLMALVTT